MGVDPCKALQLYRPEGAEHVILLPPWSRPRSGGSNP